jgi:hypothetical protein
LQIVGRFTGPNRQLLEAERRAVHISQKFGRNFQSKFSLNVFSLKRREKELFNGFKKNISEIKAYIDGMLTVSNELEELMGKYVKMGKDMKNFILQNMDKLFTEEHLQEKVKKSLNCR